MVPSDLNQVCWKIAALSAAAGSMIGSSSGALHFLATQSLMPTMGPSRSATIDLGKAGLHVFAADVDEPEQNRSGIALEDLQDLVVFEAQASPEWGSATRSSPCDRQSRSIPTRSA